MLLEAIVPPASDRPCVDSIRLAADASSDASGNEPIAFVADAGRSAWTMPSFYLVPFMCAYLYGAMGIIRTASFLRRTAAPGHGSMRERGDG